MTRTRQQMTTMIAVATVLLPVAAVEAAATPQDSTRVIGGELATTNPGFAVMLWDWKKNGVWQPEWQVCSATVLAPRWILTAQHCMGAEQEKNYQRISFRVNSTKAHSGGQQIRIDGWLTRHDMRLVHLAEDIKDPQVVPLAKQEPPVGSTGQIWGWGLTKPGQNELPSEDLKLANMKVTKYEETGDLGKGPAVTLEGGLGDGPYSGDSGGPFVYQGALVGVASVAAKPTIVSGGMGRYSRVLHPGNKAWIDGIISSSTLPPEGLPVKPVKNSSE